MTMNDTTKNSQINMIDYGRTERDYPREKGRACVCACVFFRKEKNIQVDIFNDI